MNLQLLTTLRKVLPIILLIGIVACDSKTQTTEKTPETILSYESITLTNVDYIAEVDYADDKDKLDIYMPGGTGKVPVLLFYHGGGLEQGDKSDMVFAANRFTKEGIGVVFANYRLSPGVMHPAHMEDAAKSFVWIKNNIKKYGGDPERVFLSGHSAGAYLAVLLAMDSSYLQTYSFDLTSIAGVIGVSPYLYVEETAKVRSKTIWGTDENVWLSASVSPYVSPEKPNMLLMYADGDDDWRKRHNETLASALNDVGNNEVDVFQISNRTHNTIWSSVNDQADSVSMLMVNFMKKN